MSIRTQRQRFGLRQVIAAVLCVFMATPAMAWKPKTHVYLAELAMRDALDDGLVTLYQTDYATGRIVGTLGAFEVNPEILAALRSNPAQYLAGVVGPDAYPDIMTGQQIIHPGTNDALLGEPAHNELPSAPGTDAWLTHLWRLAYGRQNPYLDSLEQTLNRGPLGEVVQRNDTGAIRAFVAGYLTHAAGDMFMHTFVNHYTGGDFAIQPDPRNAVKHIVLEGYVGKRTPDTQARTSIEGVERFIYREMIRARPGSVLEERLLKGATQASIPAIFSSLRNGLQRDVDRYDRERLSRSGPARVAYSTANGPAAEYKRAWIDDIDRGLQAWPATSHEISLALVYNPDGDGADLPRAQAAASKFVSDHMLSMAGAPDAVLATAAFISSVIDAILPDFLQEALAELQKQLLNWLIEEATGMSVEEMQAYLSHPENHFDRVMNTPGGGYDGRTETLTTLAEFNRSVLGVDDPGAQSMDRKFEVDRFAPAFNTLQMTKLLFLSEKGMNDLLAALRAKGLEAPAAPGVAGRYENAMLGFLTSMDGDNGWQGLAEGSSDSHGRAFFMARGKAEAWRNLFMRQIGERADWPANTAPAEDPAAAPDDSGFETIENWGVRLDDVQYEGDAGRNVAVTVTFRNDGTRDRAFSDQLAVSVRSLLNAGQGSRIPSRSMEFVHPDGQGLPRWHYPPNSAIPPQGRISVRFVFDVGSSVRQREVRSLTLVEQRPRSALTPLQTVDGASRDLPVPGLNLDGSTGAQTPSPSAAVVQDPARLKPYEGRYVTNRGTTVTFAVEGNELVGRAMSNIRPRPRELVRLSLLADGSLKGTMRDEEGGAGREPTWFDLELRFAPDGANFAGQAQYTHAPSNPLVSYTGRRAGGSASEAGKPGEPAAAAAGMSAAPFSVGDYAVALVSVQRGEDGDWETTWSVTNRGTAAARIGFNDLSVMLQDGGARSSLATSPYYHAGETGRRVRSSGFEVGPGEETKIRFWHPNSGGMSPARFQFEAQGRRSEGVFSPEG